MRCVVGHSLGAHVALAFAAAQAELVGVVFVSGVARLPGAGGGGAAADAVGGVSVGAGGGRGA